MSMGGDSEPQPIDIPGISYSPSFESGTVWSTQYSSELDGCLALSQSQYLLSNFVTRDIEGRTAGICVNPFDFNFTKTNKFDGRIAKRPDGYTKTTYEPCDCSYYKCDRDFQGMGYTLDIGLLWNGQGNLKGLKEAFVLAGGSDDLNLVSSQLDSIGYPKNNFPANGPYSIAYTNPNPIVGTISIETFNQYKTAIQGLDSSVSVGTKEAGLLTYALIDMCGSVTGGIIFKNNILSFLAFSQDVLETGEGFGSGYLSGGDAWNNIANNIIANYAKNADIPGFSAEILYEVIPGLEDVEEKCMCLDAGLYGYDAHPVADWHIVQEQLTVSPTSNGDAGGIDAFTEMGFEGTTFDLAKYLVLDSQKLKTAGVTGVKPYAYGPNWMFGNGFSDLNVVCVSSPQFKNWEVRDSGKIRMSGSPNGEPYSFGNQWQEWGQRVGVPQIEYIPISPITVGGGDFVDPNFGYKGSLEGSLIYRGRLTEDTSVYEGQDYQFGFLGITNGDMPNGSGNNNGKFFFGLTSIPHVDVVTNAEIYGVSGSIEDIIFSSNFSESPQDKTIYRL